MKSYLIFLTILLFSLSSFAQQGINYKAIIKDLDGNTLSNASLGIKFSIYEGPDLINLVYEETHTGTTNDIGLLIVNIGEGFPSLGAFPGISWSSNRHFLNIEVDYDNTFIDLGTTEFKYVPYAKHAVNAEFATIAANVTGLEALDEGNGIGWRLKGKDPTNYGNIGLGATDLSSSDVDSELGATGNYSTAMGIRTSASGENSAALGFGTSASGQNSTALGNNTFAVADNSLAIGWLNIEEPDGLFVIGNGSSTGGSFNQSNAFTVLNNGTITAPSFDISEITDDKALITKEYFDINLPEASTGLGRIIEPNTDGFENIGWRFVTTNSENYATIGEGAVDLSISFTNSTTNGASGSSSVAMGLHTIAPSYGETTIGIYNTNYTPISKTSRFSDDRLLVVGNGVSNTNRSNALIILKNGTITAPSFDLFEITDDKALVTKEYTDSNYLKTGGNVVTNNIGIGRPASSSLFEVAHPNSPPNSGDYTNAFSIHNTGTGGSWQFSTVSAGHLSIYKNGSYRGFFNEATGVYGSISDRRAKKDIKSLNNGTLNKVMQLNPVSYLMKDQTDAKRNFGLISQEVKEIFPTLTSYVDGQDLLALSYTELIPVLIKAIQEQQDIIEKQNLKLETQVSENTQQNQVIQSLLQRIDTIEASMN